MIAYVDDVALIGRGKFPQLRPLGDAPLILSDKVKYLGIILDSTLTWKPNIEERVRKATIALYECKGAIGKKQL